MINAHTRAYWTSTDLRLWCVATYFLRNDSFNALGKIGEISCR